MRGFVRIAIALCAAVSACSSEAANPDALWQIVHDRCLPNARVHQDPAPCASVDAGDAFAILKDRRGVAQYLLIPTDRHTGIEDPALLAPGAHRYWHDAWAAGDRVSARLGVALAPDELSLAVNSRYGRSQEQLHIHIDCIAPAVRAALEARAASIGPEWEAFIDPLSGHPYRVRRVASLDGPADDPFRLVAREQAGESMGGATILVTGVPGGGGFLILAGHADPARGNPGSAEELQDHDCTVASVRRPAGTR